MDCTVGDSRGETDLPNASQVIFLIKKFLSKNEVKPVHFATSVHIAPFSTIIYRPSISLNKLRKPLISRVRFRLIIK